MRRTRHAGTTVVELLIGSLLALLTGAALFNLMQANYTGQSAVQGQNFANASSRQALDILADTLRNAQSVQVGSLSQALGAASSSDVTCYTGTNAATDFTRIWVANGTMWRTKTIGGMTSAPEALTKGVQSLTLTYLVPVGGQYTTTTGAWNTSVDPNAELPNIGAADIQVVVTINGSMRTLESFVRLRNSPFSHTGTTVGAN